MPQAETRNDAYSALPALAAVGVLAADLILLQRGWMTLDFAVCMAVIVAFVAHGLSKIAQRKYKMGLSHLVAAAILITMLFTPLRLWELRLLGERLGVAMPSVAYSPAPAPSKARSISSILYPSGSVTKAITVLPPLTGPGSRVTLPPLALTASQAA
jgi:hypothetical protein